MFKRLKNFFSGGSNPPSTTNTGFVDIYGRPIENGIEFFYPKKNVGIPVFSQTTIYRQHLKMINDIIDKSMIGDHRRTPDGDSVIDELYRKVIKRYISYAHMLPASENHHHSNTGGLIAHSLQAALFSLQYGRSAKPESTQFQDVDKMVEPIYRYASFVGGLLHDAGKISRDMTVEAVDIIDNKKNRPATKKDAIPVWRPQKESLLGWAQRFGVATYSVKFKPDRLHNSHNIDSAMFLPRIVGTGFAFDYLIENPVNVFKVLSESLSGHETSSDYLSTCIRKADILSVTKDVSMLNDEKLGDRNMSKEALILKSMQAMKPEWDYNVPFGDVWILGDAVYLRYTKAFDAILKKGQSLQYPLPSDSRIIISIMESSGMLESYDNDNKIFNFAPGIYSHEDIEKIFLGEMTPNVEQLLKLKWKGTLFGSDPMPDNGDGILLSHDGNLIEKVSAHGKVTRYEREKVMNDLPPSRRNQAVLPAQAEHSSTQYDQNIIRTPADAAPPPHEPMPLMDENGNIVSETNHAPVDTAPSHDQIDHASDTTTTANNKAAPLETDIVSPTSKAKSTKPNGKGIRFKNAPENKTENDTQNKSDHDSDNKVGTKADNTSTPPASDDDDKPKCGKKTNAPNPVDSERDSSDGCEDTAVEPEFPLHPVYEKLNPKYQDNFGKRGVGIFLEDLKSFFDTNDISAIKRELNKNALLVVDKDGVPLKRYVKVKGQSDKMLLCLVRPDSIPLLTAGNGNKKNEKKVEKKDEAKPSEQPVQHQSEKSTSKKAGKPASQNKSKPVKQQQNESSSNVQLDTQNVQSNAKKDIQSSEKNEVPAKAGYQQHLPSTEGVDYGLISALMSPRKGSLAEKIKLLQEQGHTDFYTEAADGVSLDIRAMSRYLSVGNTILPRHMIRELRNKHHLERNNEGFVLIPYDQLNLIEHKDGL